MAWFQDESGKYGFLNSDGEVVIEPQFYAVSDFRTHQCLNRNKALIRTEAEACGRKDRAKDKRLRQTQPVASASEYDMRLPILFTRFMTVRF